MMERYSGMKPTRLPSSSKSRMNAGIDKVTGGGRPMRDIPLDHIFDTLLKEGAVPLQEDGTKWSGILSGRNGRVTIDLGSESSKDGDTYVPYTNAMLVIEWHKFDTGTYEVVSYVS